METPEKLRSRIETAGELQSVVKTMKGLSAVSIRSYEKAAAAVESYGESVRLGLQVLLSQNRELHLPLPRESPRPRCGVIVFGSEQGLCGPFNRRICEHTVDVLRGKNIDPDECALAAAGSRLGDVLSNHVTAPVELHHMPASVDAITGSVADLLELVTAWIDERRVNRVLLFHQRPLSGAACEPTDVTLFPFDENWIADLRDAPWPTRCLPAHFSEPTVLLRTLVRHYLFIVLYKAFATSLASEHAARLASMQAAENNIEERLTRLRLEFHRVRQEAITEELLDVTSGFEALSRRRGES